MEEKITAYAKELGLTGEDISIRFDSKRINNGLFGWQIVTDRLDKETELKKLEDFILNYEYDKEIDNFVQLPILAVNMIDR